MSPVATAPAESELDPLTAHDRCDRCCAQAQRRFQLVTGDLVFCDHHAREYGEALAVAVKVPRSL